MSKPKVLIFDIEERLPVVMGVRGSPLKYRVNEDGYYEVKVDGVYKKLHRLIAEQYVDNPLGLETVDHIDGDKSNNSVHNLQWMSRRDNVKKALDRPVIAIKEKGVSYYYPSQASAKFDGFSQPNISKVVNKERPHHKGYKWEMLSE